MTTELRTFLQEHAAKYAAEKATVEEWRKAIEDLFNEIRGWLKESDPGGFIDIKITEEDINEPELGHYLVPRLDLRVLGKWIGIIPKARRTIGSAKPPRKSAPERALGRVDITDELRRYILYRFREGKEDIWLIDDVAVVEKTWPGEIQSAPRSEPKRLSAETFEKVLLSYLR